MLRRRLSFVSTLVVALVSWGCENVTGLTDEEIEGTLGEAIAALEDAMYEAVHLDSVADLDGVSFQEAHDLFSEVYEDSPDNGIAAFGYALTTIFLMEDHPDVRALAEDLEAMDDDESDPSLIPALVGAASMIPLEQGALPLDFSTERFRRVANAGLAPLAFPRDPMFAEAPAVADVQEVLREVVLPRFTEALDALARIEDPTFVFTITERMQGEDEETGNPLELDFTEVLALRAGLSVAVAAIEVATAYILEPDPLDGGAALVAALDPSSTFLTLAPSGADGLENALDRLLDATEFVLAGLSNLQAETDDQSDDIIKYDPTGTGDGVTAEDIADAEEIIQDIQSALTEETIVTIPGDEPDSDVEITANLREFFIDPIEDFKALLPDYDVFLAMEGSDDVAVLRWDALNLDEWVIPDPSISGILPEMETTADLLDTFPLEGVFVGASVAGGTYRLTTIDGLDCYATLFGEAGAGCLVDDQYYYDGEVRFEGRDGDARVDFSAWGDGAFFHHEGTYEVSSQVELIYPIDMSLVPDFGDPFELAADLEDHPGYTHFDAYGRTRGGSELVFNHLGGVWVFERQD